jgi:hypothetical protein
MGAKLRIGVDVGGYEIQDSRNIQDLTDILLEQTLTE